MTPNGVKTWAVWYRNEAGTGRLHRAQRRINARAEAKGWPETRSPLTHEALARLGSDELRGVVDAANDLANRTVRYLPSERAYRAILESDAQKLTDLTRGTRPECLPAPAIEWDR